MEINKRAVRGSVVNPEGSIVFERLPEIQLYLEASNLKIKEGTFYQSAPERLKSIIDLSRKMDEAYMLGLSKFLANNGLKLSPVVMLSILSDRKFSFKDHSLSYIFNTPQRIAEAVGMESLGFLHLNNSFKKNILKRALENMNEFTLRKNRMERKKIKLKDLIKLLRPKPKDKTISELYKAIIESSKTAKLKDKDTLVSAKSSKAMSADDKKKYFTENIEKIPLNQLVRNLAFLEMNFDFSEGNKLKEKIIKRLNSVDSLRFLNLFDLIEACIHVPQMEKALFEVLKKHVYKFKKEFDYIGDTTILFDFSGSMNGDGFERGFKYLILFSILNDNINLRAFSNGLFDEKFKHVLTQLKVGLISDAHEQLNKFFNSHSSGTALLDSVKELMDEDENITSMIVISDEVSWLEGSDLRDEISEVSDLMKGTKLILINPVVYKGTVFKDNVLGISALTSSVMFDVMAFENPNKFIDFIRKY